jgi:hypothetical protein
MIWIMRGLGIIGAIALAAGLVNVLAPGSSFPSRTTCVTDDDLIMCYIEPWSGALWVAIAGGIAIAIAWTQLRRRAGSSASSDGTR